MNRARSPEEELRGAGATVETWSPDGSVKQEPVPLTTISAASLAGLPVPQRRFLDTGHLIPMRNVTMLSGDGGTGKSLLALQLAVAVAGGVPWISLGVDRGRALYLSAEDEMAELHARLAAICQVEAVDLSTLGDLHLADLSGRDAILAQETDKASRLAPAPLLDQMKARLSLLRPRLVVLDNLADVFAGNENVRPLARQFISMLRAVAIEFDCAVLMLAHPSLSGINSGTGTSGSTAWNNSVRSRLYLLRETDEHDMEVDSDRRVLETMKANYGPIGSQIMLRWEAGRFVCVSHVGGSSAFSIDRDRLARDTFMTLLEWHDSHNIAVSPNRSSTYAPAVFSGHPLADGIRRRDFEKAMNRLFDEGAIEVIETGPPSRRRSRIVWAGSRGVEVESP